MNKKILIVEDDPAILEAMELILSEEGYEVLHISDGEEAVTKVNTFRPQLVLLDMLMSGADGREICKLVKSDPKLRETKVVIVSAYPDAEKIVREYGADDFLAKPFEVVALLRLVGKYMEGE